MAFGIGIVGAGMAAAPHYLALRDLVPDVVVRGVLTRNPVRAASVEAAGFAVVSNLADQLNNPGVDALLVLTPPDARMGIVQATVAAGKHLLEKPLERDAAAALRAMAAGCC